ncbi:vomeronasal secretory protein 2-like [Thomomys bottae]
MPTPPWKWNRQMPPVSFVINNFNKLEFRMNMPKPTGCVQFKLPLDVGTEPGTFFTWWKHTVQIYFMPDRNYTCLYLRGYMNYKFYHMMIMMGRISEASAESMKIFKAFIATKFSKTTKFFRPPSSDACDVE